MSGHRSGGRSTPRRRARHVLWVRSLLIVAAGLPGALVAQDARRTQDARGGLPTVFGLLEGRWTGEGTLMGRQGAFEMAWERPAPDRAVLTFSNGFIDSTGAVTPVLEAVANYTRDAADAITARWTDDRPQEIDIVAEAGDSVIVSEWTAPAERGRTEYRISADGTVRVRDWVYSAGEPRLFAEARYTRAPPRSLRQTSPGLSP